MNNPNSQSNESQIETLASNYNQGTLNRREFLSRLAILTGSMAAAHLLLEKSGLAQVISQKETQGGTIQISGSDVSYPNGEIPIGGYLATPSGAGPFPAILVIHENRDLNEHTRDVARRFAIEGFVALAPDALSRRGGTASMKTPDEARTAIGTISAEEALADLEAGLAYLDTLPNVQKGRLASIGFCWGGARSFALATQSARLRAAIVFYGSAPPIEQLDNVKCPVLGIYGETDERITSRVPEVASAMKAAGKAFDFHIYPRAGHAFFNDTGERYDPLAAADAWARSLRFLRAHLEN
ncbi:MAG: dienelactone hydrolase family protein [Armatimonadetes bacterium]|nr:dienelactone hydrolase family protein [Armatimonadota bacterium]